MKNIGRSGGRWAQRQRSGTESPPIVDKPRILSARGALRDIDQNIVKGMTKKEKKKKTKLVKTQERNVLKGAAQKAWQKEVVSSLKEKRPMGGGLSRAAWIKQWVHKASTP